MEAEEEGGVGPREARGGGGVAGGGRGRRGDGVGGGAATRWRTGAVGI